MRNGSVDTELNTGYTVTPNAAATAGGGSLTITFDNLKTVASVTSDSEIVVKYTAKLLNTAVIGQPGNPNEVYLEYASNPNFSGTGTPPTSHTPEDTVLVFTYQLNVNKVDGADTTKHLSGAEFKLKCVKAETEATWNGKWVTVADNKVTGWVDTQDKGTALTTGTDGLAWVAGLDAGTYELYETKAPVGYNRVKDPITIVIAATLDKGEDTPALTALTIKVGSGAAEDGNMAGGTVAATVQNNAGATLPETGGIGTTLFYIIGGTLMVGAAVFLVIRKRIPTWKRRLTDHIKEAMEQSRTQQEFVAYMNAYGYDVKWEPHQKYITYTTPENIRCRDSKLFDQTLKRENMELYFRLGGADYLQACREIAYDHREPTPTLEDAVCGMAGTVAAICALCEAEDSEVSDLARELYYSSLLLQELVEWYQSRRQEQENYEEEYGQYHGFDMTMM